MTNGAHNMKASSIAIALAACFSLALAAQQPPPQQSQTQPQNRPLSPDGVASAQVLG